MCTNLALAYIWAFLMSHFTDETNYVSSVSPKQISVELEDTWHLSLAN